MIVEPELTNELNFWSETNFNQGPVSYMHFCITMSAKVAMFLARCRLYSMLLAGICTTSVNIGELAIPGGP